jgi:hypothetical protein
VSLGSAFADLAILCDYSGPSRRRRVRTHSAVRRAARGADRKMRVHPGRLTMTHGAAGEDAGPALESRREASSLR